MCRDDFPSAARRPNLRHTMPSRIVTTVHRPKRPPQKRKAVALAVPAIVTKAGNRKPTRPAEPQTAPANDDRRPAIVTAASRKQRRAERSAAMEADNSEADSRVKAFFARMIRPP